MHSPGGTPAPKHSNKSHKEGRPQSNQFSLPRVEDFSLNYGGNELGEHMTRKCTHQLRHPAPGECPNGFFVFIGDGIEHGDEVKIHQGLHGRMGTNEVSARGLMSYEATSDPLLGAGEKPSMRRKCAHHEKHNLVRVLRDTVQLH